jgi:hypothetical protein
MGRAPEDCGGDYDFIVFGRLQNGMPLAQSIAELDTLEKRIAAEHKLDDGLRVRAWPLQEVMAWGRLF